MNKIFLKGRIGHDWEVKDLGENKVANTSLATSEKYKGEEKTQWHRLNAWNKTAEILSQYTKKGSELLIEGKVEYRDWNDKDGNKRTSTEIIVERFHFIGGSAATSPIGEPKKSRDLPF